MSRFPKDCWDKNCEHFHVTDMSVDDLLCACGVLGYECDACDEDYCYLRCPLEEKVKLHCSKCWLAWLKEEGE